MNLLPNYKEIIELVKKGATLEAQGKITELRESAISLREENIQLRERIKELENKLNLKENLYYEKPYYWLKDGDNKDGPFCQKCYDSESKLIRLQILKRGFWICKSCQKSYEDDSFNINSGYEDPPAWDEDI